jgi:transmembrane sensor
MSSSDPTVLWEEEEDAVSERAADFFARRRCGDWSDTDQAELDAWLAESVLHEAAYLRVEGIAARADQLAAFRALKLRRAAAVGNGRFRHRWFALPLLAAASVALAAMFGGRFAASLMQPPDRSFSTDVGGRTFLSFSDHTQIELNTDTVLRFRMTTAERTVWLEKGEAWFHVAHDAAHPFAVIAGRHRITDLGTEFFVRRGSDGVEVALLNGRAALSTEGAQTATLTPGDDAVATPSSVSVARKTQQELADELAWRRGMLVFRKTKLADVVREFNRYNTTRLVISDPSIADEPFTADLKTDDFGAFLNLAQTVLNLRAVREGNDILISRGQREETKRTVHIKHSL